MQYGRHDQLDDDRSGRAARDATDTLRGPVSYIAEFVGTCLLVLFIVCVLSLGAVSPSGFGFNDWAVVGLVHTFILMVLVISLGGASGAHFNPAVTIALAARRLIGPIDAAIYLVAQILGALLAVLIAKQVMSTAAEIVDFGAPRINDKQFVAGSVPKAMIVEAIGAFVLMWAIMATAVNPRGSRNWAALVIGAALGLAVMVFGPATGGSFNPARAFAPMIFSDFGSIGESLLVYLLAPIVGTLIAAFGYSALVLAPQLRLEMRPIDKLD